MTLKILVVCKNSFEKQSSPCRIINNSNLYVTYAWKDTLSPKDIKDIDFVVSIGGDGTALSASHYLLDKPLLAVNSNPEKSVGALTTISLEKLDKKINQIVSKDYETEKLERIQVTINEKPLEPLALNDVFIANEKAYLISKYKISLGKEEEIQLSSGLIFSTGTGSTAWFKSASGIPFSPQSKFIKMIVREPYQNKTDFKLLEKTIQENEEVIIQPLTPMVLAIDSIREIKITEKDKIKIKISRHPLIRIK